ncbi:MAG: filamentous hemagglutinin N-terminal domain-containing protein, partial [Zoogloeaceae bacterium]|nr:filamentous hemagglutinin N-terminal domain-containing protein [Zoogloeaceae bacterium]
MNANLHRIVFNRSRGQFMVVAESARSSIGGTPSSRRTGAARTANSALRKLTLAILLAQTWPAHAQIVADPTAAAGQQAHVRAATNGVPLVNITRPSNAGVSRNTYSQFDVERQGAILNNARTNAKTQLGGWVEGNANLSAGSARVILNEVNSADPSQLLGYIEVAGSRAEVVVANPSGITCNGCGFINADRATLTTGQAVMLDGRLDGYRVEGGRIIIEGTGMDASGADYATLIARAVEINAGLWAQDLTVTTGPGLRAPDGTPGEDVATAEAAPAFAIDVSALGGMYAGKIKLIGTEAGLGVRNAGQLGASAGEIVVTADGLLTNTGSIAATGDIRINSADATNRGLISSAQTLDIATATLDNAHTNADELGLEGRDVRVTASTIDNRHGAIRADRDIEITSSGTLDNGNGLISALEKVTVGDPQDTLAITNTGGVLIAGEQLDVAAASLTGAGSLLSHGGLRLQLGGDFDNQSDVAANGAVTLDVENVLSNQGRIESGSTLQLTAGSVDNHSAGSITGDTVNLTADTLTNRGLIDGNTVHITTTRSNNLGGGRIYGGDLSIAIDILNQDEEGDVAPVIAARNRLDLGVGTLTNRNDALIFSAGDLAIGGLLDDNGRATGSAALMRNHGGTIEALGALDIAATDIENSNAGLVTTEEVLESRLIQEVQPEGWPERLDASFFPSIFNHKIEKQPYVVDGVVVARFEDYTFYEYTETQSITRVESSRPGDIVAGGNITLTGNVDNHDSRILAGGVLTHTGGDLTNRSSEGARTTSYDGWRQFRDWDGNDERLEFGSKRTFSPAPIIESFNLDIARVEDGQSVTGSGTTLAPLTIGSAGGAAYGRNTLLRPVTDPTATYLIETDPRFASYGQWISSDYMLGQLGLDPAALQKRLGDGFHEQQLLREQIAGLTGHRFLDGHASDEAQYMALMNAGITYAQEWGLIPGVALTAEQMAALTTDMVWLVERKVTLPDGRSVQALVPQLYARPTAGDLRADGALLAGDILNVQTTGQVTNLGTLAGRKLVVLDADRVTHNGGQIRGDIVHLETANDLRVIGGNITAGQSMSLSAGTDLEITSTTRDTNNFATGDFTRSHIDGLATLHVQQPGGKLQLAAAGDISLIAAQLLNNTPAASGEAGQDAGTTRILAGGNLTLRTVLEATRNHTGAGKDINNSGSRTDVGTHIDSTGDIVVSAHLETGRIDMTAARLSSAEGGIAAQAADITINAGSDHRYSDISFEKSWSGFLSSAKKYQRDRFDSTTAVGSTLSAETVTLVAGQDLSMRGSDVVSNTATTLVAGRDLNIEAAEETHLETHIFQEKASGMFSSGGVGVTIGSRASSNEADTTTVLARGSTVGSVEGDVTLLAGQNYRQVGSDVLTTQGNIDIAAERADILDARENSLHTQESKSKQSGLTIAVTAPVITAVQTAQQMQQASKDTSDGRMKALAGATTALAAMDAYVQTNSRAAGGVNFTLSIG